MIKTCEGCGKEYEAKYETKRYCSMQCRKVSTKVLVKCANCGKEFIDQRSAHTKYCSISCGVSARNKTSLNPSYKRDITGEKNPMYGKGLSGEKNGMYGKRGAQVGSWRGGRKTRKDGYVLVVAPEGHPYPSDRYGHTAYILEHRHVMEQHIGRFLEPQEVVHHIDRNPRNNAIENLVLYKNQSEHIRLGHGKK